MTPKRRIYFVDHNIRTITWDDLRLPPTVKTRRNYQGRIIYFQSQPAMHLITDVSAMTDLRRSCMSGRRTSQAAR
ncbi:hypothetical protein BJY52DRAFT_1296788, partial [Lactarius psammicola]